MDSTGLVVAVIIGLVVQYFVIYHAVLAALRASQQPAGEATRHPNRIDPIQRLPWKRPKA